MRLRRPAALLYAGVSVGVVVFQVALAAGAPWGAYAMGGAFPGRFPLTLRIAALAQAALIAGMAVVVLSRAGLVLAGWFGVTRRLVWLVVAFAAVSLVLNLITPRAGERAIWAPVALLLLASSTVVATTTGSGRSERLGVELEAKNRHPLA
jgi:hypothetical protein